MLIENADETRTRETEVSKLTKYMNTLLTFAHTFTYDFLFGTWSHYIDLRAQSLQTVCFTWRQLQTATNNFDQANKLGEGGFGSVFKVY